MKSAITNVSIIPDVAMVTVNNIPNGISNISTIFEEMSRLDLNLDMISQTAPYKDKLNISFTLSQDDLDKVVLSTGKFKKISGGISTDINGNNAKVILYGEEMKNESGVASRIFKMFSDIGVDIKLITTSECEISCLIDSRDTERVKKAFQS